MTTTRETVYRHRFETPEGYLHHRRPYLLVETIEEIDDRRIRTSKTVRADEFYVPGHFPGAPVFPGALMQELTTQSAGCLIAANFNPMAEYRTEDPRFNEFALGVLVRVHHARYWNFARPGDQLTVNVWLEEQVGDLFEFRAQIDIGEQRCMRNAFQLANIRSELLYQNSRS
jgi:3-hydroxyacyl-[acyl-carrier-protein] dehydratase